MRIWAPVQWKAFGSGPDPCVSVPGPTPKRAQGFSPQGSNHLLRFDGPGVDARGGLTTEPEEMGQEP